MLRTRRLDEQPEWNLSWLFDASSVRPNRGHYALDGRPIDIQRNVLIASALVVDVVALAAIASRISEFGFTANRVAALGEKPDPARQPRRVGMALRRIPARAHTVPRARGVADRVPAGVRDLAALVVVLFPPLFAYA